MYNFVEKNYFKLNTLYMETGSVTIRYGGAVYLGFVV